VTTRAANTMPPEQQAAIVAGILDYAA